jgi:hypothetical protein
VSKINIKLVDRAINKPYTSGKQASALRVESTGDAVMATKKTLTEQDIAALAAGASLEASVSPELPEVTGEGDMPEVGAEAEAPEVEAEAEPKAEVVAEVDTSAGTVKLLSSQLKAAQDDLLAARLQLSRLEDKQAELEAVVAPMKAIVCQAANHMRIALGGSALDMSASTAAQVIADHAAMAANFKSKFKAGGVAVVEPDVTGSKSGQKVDALTVARFNAVRSSK